MASVREETLRGIKWGVVQKCTMQPVQFLYGVILARLISPDEMGILGLTAIFFAFAGQLQQCGFGTALIRKQDRTDEDICTVFWFNVAMSFVFSLALFLAAPWFVWFFDQPALLNLTRVSALLMFLGSTGSVHWTLYSARRDFKTPAIVSMCTTLVSMPFTIWAAFAGWSYWAPMLQGIISGLLGLITVWIISPWKPSFKFSSASFREFFAFGSRITASAMLITVYDESRTFIIGKFYSPAQLATFSRAFQLCSAPMTLGLGVLSGIFFPIITTLQNTPAKMAAVFNKYCRILLMLTTWVMFTLAANAHSIIYTVYGERWVSCAPYMMLLCFGIMCNPLAALNNDFVNANGRSDLTMKCTFFIKIISIICMICGALHSVEGICVAAIATGWIALFFYLHYTSKVSSITIKKQLGNILFYSILCGIALLPSITLCWLTCLSSVAKCIIGPGSSLLIYVILLEMLHDGAYIEIKSLILEKIKKPATS